MTQLLDKTQDQIMIFPGTWDNFRLVQWGLSESSGARLSYYDGMIEILMPGELHEVFAHIIGYLVTTFLLKKGISFVPTRQKDQGSIPVFSPSPKPSPMQGEGFDPFMLPFSHKGRRGWGKRVARRQPKSGMLPRSRTTRRCFSSGG
jgi:hypothetical protein